jgi:TnpA family transposase
MWAAYYMTGMRRALCTRRRSVVMNKASCLSLISNATLYRHWNTLKINDVVETLQSQGEDIDKETLSHISLLPFKHVVPNGTYFIEDVWQG